MGPFVGFHATQQLSTVHGVYSFPSSHRHQLRRHGTVSHGDDATTRHQELRRLSAASVDGTSSPKKRWQRPRSDPDPTSSKGSYPRPAVNNPRSLWSHLVSYASILKKASRQQPETEVHTIHCIVVPQHRINFVDVLQSFGRLDWEVLAFALRKLQWLERLSRQIGPLQGWTMWWNHNKHDVYTTLTT